MLADVFGEPFASIATVLDRSEQACRQLASRGRRKLRAVEPLRTDPSASARDVVDRFATAIALGDEATAIACLADDAILMSDGGPPRRAARRPVLGPHRIHRLLANLDRRARAAATQVEPALVGGVPGFVITNADGVPEVAIGIEVASGTIRRILLTLNPDKLDAIWLDPGTIE